ncbi:MAG: P-type conjugative transfer protein TrbL [Desulfobulbus sp.]|nr:P-type conjugative transfer protein TrbL [Desulfobulbus sp.]
MRIIKFLPLAALFICLFGFSSIGLADISRDVVYDITEKFSTKSSVYGVALKIYAEKLFYWCLILDTAILGCRVIMKREDIASAIKHFVFMLLFAGFIFSVIKNYDVWSMNLVNGLKLIAVGLGGPELALSPFNTGVEIVISILDKMSATDPVDSLGYLITGCIIMVCFALMTAQIVMIKCESYIAMNAAVLLLGFGGSSFLKEYAINTMRYALSVAFKLFVMQLVLGLGMSFIKDFRTLSSIELADLLVLIGAAVVLLALVKTIPDVCAGIINGSHTGNGGSLMSTGSMVAGVGMAAGAAAAGGSASLARGVGSVRAAVQMAGYEGKTGWGKLGGAARNLMNANSASRRDQNAWGSIGQRMNSHLKEGRDTAELQATLKKDQAAEPSGKQ